MRYTLLVSALMLAMTSPAMANDLTKVLEAATEADPEYAAARQNWYADQQVLTQGRAGLLPSVNASYAHLRNDVTIESTPEIDQEYDTQTTTLSLVQPLFRPENWYGYGQARSLTNAAEASFTQARQDFLLRVAEKYTDVLRAWDNLVASRAAERAIGRQLDQTGERFEVGLVPITDVHEARAVYDLARVNLIVAESDFSVARDELEAFTGKKLEFIYGLRADLPMTGPEPASPDAWVERARENNPALLSARFNADAARSASRQGLSRQLPSVDLVGQYQHVHNLDESSNAALAPSQTDRNGNSIGLEVSMPLFAGGALNSQRVEASYRYQAAEEQYRLTYRDVSQSAQSLTRVVMADAQRVQARRAARLSAESALKATESGYEVGTRNAVDLLNAQQSLYQAQRDYAFARYDYLVNSLRLKSLAGMLDKKDITDINAWLSPDVIVRLDDPVASQVKADQASEGQQPATP